jgi:thioredoxin-like negative regulator of GroEL
MSPPAVFVFLQDGCPACHEFGPRITRLAHPFRAQGFPVGFYDMAKDTRAAELGQRLGVNATPTTIVMRNGQLHKHVGALADTMIAKLLKFAFG